MRFLMRLIAFLLLVLVLIFGVLFTVQNTDKAPLDLLLVQLPAQRISLWILLAFALGGFIGLLISSAAIVRLKSQTLLLQRRLDKLDKASISAHGDELRVSASKR